jgi:hypothetical protein
MRRTKFAAVLSFTLSLSLVAAKSPADVYSGVASQMQKARRAYQKDGPQAYLAALTALKADDKAYLQKIFGKLPAVPEVVAKGTSLEIQAEVKITLRLLNARDGTLQINDERLSLSNYRSFEALHKELVKLINPEPTETSLFRSLNPLPSAHAAISTPGWVVIASLAGILGITLWRAFGGGSAAGRSAPSEPHASHLGGHASYSEPSYKEEAPLDMPYEAAPTGAKSSVEEPVPLAPLRSTLAAAEAPVARLSPAVEADVQMSTAAPAAAPRPSTPPANLREAQAQSTIPFVEDTGWEDAKPSLKALFCQKGFFEMISANCDKYQTGTSVGANWVRAYNDAKSRDAELAAHFNRVAKHYAEAYINQDNRNMQVSSSFTCGTSTGKGLSFRAYSKGNVDVVDCKAKDLEDCNDKNLTLNGKALCS